MLILVSLVKPYLVLAQSGKTPVSCHTDLHCCHFCAFTVTLFFIAFPKCNAHIFIRLAKQANLLTKLLKFTKVSNILGYVFLNFHFICDVFIHIVVYMTDKI